MASIKKFYSRTELGLRTPVSISKNISPQNGGVAVHYGGGAQRVTSQKQARERWLAWQTFHMLTRGWVDVAYTAGFDNWGNVYAGRGYGVRTAANGTNAGNQNFYAFCWIGGGNEQPSDSALEALNWLIEDARKNGGAGNAVKSHGNFTNTSCPGSILRSRASELDGKSNLPGVGGDSSEPSAPESRNYITVGDKGAEVKSWQQDLRKWNSSALPRFGADGDFGSETAQWTVRFYDAVGLTASDRSAPRVGEASHKAMREALASKPSFSFEHSTTIRSGSKGAAVREWQRALRQWRRGALPRFGADGDFGAETTAWTRRFQSASGVAVDGIVGPQTRRAMTRKLNR